MILDHDKAYIFQKCLGSESSRVGIQNDGNDEKNGRNNNRRTTMNFVDKER